MNYLPYLLLILCAIWVYRDATRLNSRSREQGIQINLHPIPWALLTLIAWIVFFPLYLYERHKAKRLLESDTPTGATAMKSSMKPVIGVVALLVVIAGGWAAWNYLNRLPDCSNEDTVELLNKIVRSELAGTEDPKLLEHFNALVKVDINAIETLEHTKDPERYKCSATINVDLGPEVMAVMGLNQQMIDNPNLLTAIVLGPILDKVYGPLEGLRVKFTSSWAKEKGETRHYVSARLSNPGATGYATLTEAAWVRMQEKKNTESAAVQVAPQKNAVAAPQAQATEPVPTPATTPKPSPAPVSKVPEGPNTETAMPGRSVDVRTTVPKLSAAWLQTMSAAQTGDEIAMLYADQVDFYGKANVSRAAIAKEKAAFVRRWPERQYQATGSPGFVSGTQDSATWVQTFSYKVTDGQKSNSGQSTLEFTAHRIGNEWLIVAEKKAQ